MKDNEIEQYHISTVNKRVLEIALPLVTYKTEQLERMWCTVGGDINWYRHYREGPSSQSYGFPSSHVTMGQLGL